MKVIITLSGGGQCLPARTPSAPTPRPLPGRRTLGRDRDEMRARGRRCLFIVADQIHDLTIQPMAPAMTATKTNFRFGFSLHLPSPQDCRPVFAFITQWMDDAGAPWEKMAVKCGGRSDHWGSAKSRMKLLDAGTCESIEAVVMADGGTIPMSHWNAYFSMFGQHFGFFMTGCPDQRARMRALLDPLLDLVPMSYGYFTSSEKNADLLCESMGMAGGTDSDKDTYNRHLRWQRHLREEDIVTMVFSVQDISLFSEEYYHPAFIHALKAMVAQDHLRRHGAGVWICEVVSSRDRAKLRALLMKFGYLA